MLKKLHAHLASAITHLLFIHITIDQSFQSLKIVVIQVLNELLISKNNSSFDETQKIIENFFSKKINTKI